MSLIHFSISPTTSVRSSPSFFPSSPLHSFVPSSVAKDSFSISSSSKLFNSSSRSRFSLYFKDDVKRSGWVFTVRSSLDTVGPTATVGQVTEVTKDTFWPIVNSAGEKIVVLDMYTQWCGPCKVIAPKFKDLSEKYLDVVFLKLDCNQDNKSLAAIGKGAGHKGGAYFQNSQGQ
ncbi:thioredoxin F-type, chloroplastic isoform X2 [Manihot esculenta]|uniref:thioredoxin F-type, chloroplastic isoform X2 n=1 Tax=Manihot esculenta TaxID=3983 RepID=UPI000B5D729F|nr:thioredoxin F-type, chloroplastic isoform X2 [Manihot esculenta]